MSTDGSVAVIPFDHPMQRAAMTISCRDAEHLPKVADAGRVVATDDGPVQIMHNGLKVRYGGYYGDWMANIIHGLRGHHEPQEEKCFAEVLRYCRPRSTILELGSFWAFYSMWYLHAVPFARACCIEPDPDHLEVGRHNMRLNGLEADFVQASIGGRFEATTRFRTESDRDVEIPQHDAVSATAAFALNEIELLHVDVQGSELAFLAGAAPLFDAHRIRFVIVSTHHGSISGSTTTHRDCVELLRSRGANLLCEHDVDESFSGDGLIVAAMRPEDRRIPAIAVSRCRRGDSLFPDGY